MTAPRGLDLARLQAYLDSPVPLTATMFAGGRSNLTYAVTDGTRRWVLRRPPLGHVLPTAHDMAREHKVLDALSKAGFPKSPRPIFSGSRACRSARVSTRVRIRACRSIDSKSAASR